MRLGSTMGVFYSTVHMICCMWMISLGEGQGGGGVIGGGGILYPLSIYVSVQLCTANFGHFEISC
jgi:hypothetical protein